MFDFNKIKENYSVYSGIISSSIITASYITFTFYFFDIDIENIRKLKEIDKIGAFLAGFFAPLAFLYLMTQYIIQHSSYVDSKKSSRMEKETFEKRLKPYFEIKDIKFNFKESSGNAFGGSTKKINTSKVEIKLSNLGARIKKVRVSFKFDNKTEESYELTDSLDYLIELEKVININTFNQNSQKIEIKFHYLNELNDKGRTTFQGNLYVNSDHRGKLLIKDLTKK
ncbi:hypothetical protein [Marinomonas gallaica]|uniref:hypothetical protein n=1 Tax=Marinomonas gallaica TaxID=1806667 RepID=UPI003A92C1C6